MSRPWTHALASVLLYVVCVAVLFIAAGML